MDSKRIGRMIKIISTYMEQDCNKDLLNLNLTRTQMGTLIYIFKMCEEGSEVNQIDIEREFNLKNPTVTGILNRLQDKDFIKRVPSEKDKRFKKIILTENAKKIVSNGKNKIDELESNLLIDLTDVEREQLQRILIKIIDKIK